MMWSPRSYRPDVATPTSLTSSTMATLSRCHGWRTPTRHSSPGRGRPAVIDVAAGVDGEVRRSGPAQVVRGTLKRPSLHESRWVDRAETFTRRDARVGADVDVERAVAVLADLVAQLEHRAKLGADLAKASARGATGG